MKSILIVVLLLVSTSCYASEWKIENTILEGMYIVSNTIDWGQTRMISRNPDKYLEEYNFLLGEHPHKDKVDLYFTLSMIAHPIVSYVLPRPYREIWQTSTLGISIYMINNNFGIGLKTRF